MLLTLGALPTLAMLLLDLAGAVQRMDDEGLELVSKKICEPFFHAALLCLLPLPASTTLTLSVFAACLPCAPVPKQPVNGSTSGGHGRANGAQRRAGCGSLIYPSPVLPSETAHLAARGSLAPQQPHWYVVRICTGLAFYHH